MSGNNLGDFLVGTAAVVGSFFAGPFAPFLASMGTSLIAQSLFGGGRSSGQVAQQGIELNTASTDRALPVVYGNVRLGLAMVEMRVDPASTEGRDLYIVGALCVGSRDGSGIEAIKEIYFDDELAFNDAGAAQGRFVGKATVTKYLGTDAQTADATLVAKFPGQWSSASAGKGIAYVVIKLTYDTAVFTSIPSITVNVRGCRLYDVRTSSWTNPGDSANPALALYDYLVSDRYGFGAATSEVDGGTTGSFATMANYYDEAVPWATGTGLRFTCRGFLDTSAPAIDNVMQLLSSCRGNLSYEGGVIKLMTRRVVTPHSLVLDSSVIVGDWQISTPGVGSAPTSLEAHFTNQLAERREDVARYPYRTSVVVTGASNTTPIIISAANNKFTNGDRVTVSGVGGNTAANGTWTISGRTTTQFQLDGSAGNGAYTSGGVAAQENPYTEADGGFETVQAVSLPMTPNRDTAEQIINVTLKELRSSLQVAVVCRESALALSVGDLVGVTHETPGWTSKYFWVTQLSILPNGLIGVALLEYDANAYSLNVQADGPTAPSTGLPNPFTVGAPTGLVLSAAPTTPDNPVGGLLASWTPPTDAFIAYYEVQAKLSTAGSWDPWGTAPLTAAPSFVLSPVTVDANWDVRVRAINTLGFPSAWVSATRTPVLPGATVNVGTMTANPAYVEFPLSFDASSTAKFAEVYVLENATQPALAEVQRGVGWAPPRTPVWNTGDTVVVRIPASPSTWYTVLVVPVDALNRTGTEVRSQVQTPASPGTVPSAPASASFTSATATSVTMSVVMPSSITGFDSIRVYRNGVQYGADIARTAGASASQSVTHTGLTPSTNYTWTYAGVGTGGVSAQTSGVAGNTSATAVPTPSLVAGSYNKVAEEQNFSITPGASSPDDITWTVQGTTTNNIAGPFDGPQVVTTSLALALAYAYTGSALGRYARVKGSRTGYSDSAWSTAIAFTIPANGGPGPV